jgi:hypothetical protein
MLEYKSATGRTFPSTDTLGKSAAFASPGGAVAPPSVDPLAHFPTAEFGLTPFNLQNSPMGTKLGGMIGKLFKKPSHDADPLSLSQSPSLPRAVSGILGNNSGGGTKVCWIPLCLVLSIKFERMNQPHLVAVPA